MIDEALYRKVIKVTCPYFNKDISFNNKGLNHLKFNGQGKQEQVVSKK